MNVIKQKIKLFNRQKSFWFTELNSANATFSVSAANFMQNSSQKPTSNWPSHTWHSFIFWSTDHHFNEWKNDG